jgi:predicted RNase H-like nuclease (RuvC/YqgF family)
MSDTVRVTSIEGLREFRDAMNNFVDDARNSLTAVEMENRRITDWLNNQKFFWGNEIKRRREKLNEIRGELHKKKLSGANDTEAKEAVRVHTARLREAEQKFETVKKWIPQLQHAIDEYLGQARPFGDLLTGDLEKAMGKLERMADALEAYINVSSPSGS